MTECAIIGNGPSATDFIQEGVTVITINEGANYYRSDIVCVADQPAYDRITAHRPGLLVVCGEDVEASPAMKVKYLDDVSECISDGLYRGTSTGAMALNLAIILGFDRIHLWGFDCQHVDGKANFFDPRELRGRITPDSTYRRMLLDFDRFWPWAERILNHSPDSAIDTFPKVLA